MPFPKSAKKQSPNAIVMQMGLNTEAANVGRNN